MRPPERAVANDVLQGMQPFIPEQAVKMRTLAAELRGHAAHTVLPEYQDKFERTAEELEDAAARLERRSRMKLAH